MHVCLYCCSLKTPTYEFTQFYFSTEYSELKYKLVLVQYKLATFYPTKKSKMWLHGRALLAYPDENIVLRHDEPCSRCTGKGDCGTLHNGLAVQCSPRAVVHRVA